MLKKLLKEIFSVQNARELIISVIGGFIVIMLPKIWSSIDGNIIIVTQIIVCIIIVSVNIFCFTKGNRLRIVKSTVEGEGGTEELLSIAKDNKGFQFMGVGAGRWVDAENFDDTMKAIALSHGTVKLILLNPCCEEARLFDLQKKKKDDKSVQQKIKESIEEFGKYRGEPFKLNIRIKVYSHMPVFRICMIEKRRIYVGAYRVDSDENNDIPQIVLEQNSSTIERMLFSTFEDYFNTSWHDSTLKEIEFEKIKQEGYYEGLAK